jgi:hypothetical protein
MHNGPRFGGIFEGILLKATPKLFLLLCVGMPAEKQT